MIIGFFSIVVAVLGLSLTLSSSRAMRTIDLESMRINVQIEGHDKTAFVFPAGGLDVGGVVCADVVTILDISCSISLHEKQRIRNISAEVAKSLLTFINPEDPTSFSSARVGLLTYSENTRHVLYLNNTNATNEVIEIFRNVEVRRNRDYLCRTATHLALTDARKYFFTSRQEQNKQVIHLYTDGLSFFRRNRKILYREQKKLKAMGVIINVIGVPQKNAKFEEEEYTNLPHTPSHLFNSTASDITQQLIDGLIRDASCKDIARSS